uniref:Uncharacterized protein n=1 Tax=Rhizophora mucronata TaxID=61149 RepID=A0A2P2PSS2_RHIMU
MLYIWQCSLLCTKIAFRLYRMEMQ